MMYSLIRVVITISITFSASFMIGRFAFWLCWHGLVTKKTLMPEAPEGYAFLIQDRSNNYLFQNWPYSIFLVPKDITDQLLIQYCHQIIYKTPTKPVPPHELTPVDKVRAARKLVKQFYKEGYDRAQEVK